MARLQPEETRSRPGHRLVWVRGASFACTTLAAADDAFAVIGRHSQCNVVLAEDPHVALRHVLVRSIALPAGGVALRVFDLHTGSGFTLPNGVRHTSIFAEGPIAFAVGQYAVVALPTEASGDELPGEMPSPVVETPHEVREQLEALALAMSPYRANARPLNRSSRITLMPNPVMVGEPMPASLGRLASGGRYGLTLMRKGRSATVTLADIDLACGVVIGRSEKCHSELLRRITDENTSRVHVLVLREGASVNAYDLASTHGTYHHAVYARRVALPDTGALLTLGRGDDAVQLHWHARG
ncbi:MAG: FHA domain-containing protein [Labilithrix sp.]|nr:FHA domain-containing protein [Labilithrix sp.]